MSRVPNFPDYEGLARAVADAVAPRLGFALDVKELADRVRSDKVRRGADVVASFDRHIAVMTDLHHG